MFDSNKYIKEFHNIHVSLTEDQRNTMRNRRNSNRKRVIRGLIENKNPEQEDFVSQGSYAMHTMVQSDGNDYDIDDGIVFQKDDLKGENGGEKSALDTRKMVRDAINDGSFKMPPEVLKNCVRIHYADGTHVDMPAYRKISDDSLELASSDWKGSSPSEVTEWYNSAVIEKSQDTINGRQMRRITKLLKAFINSRNSWKSQMISGFALSVLINENYASDSYSDDVSLYNTMIEINNRLNLYKTINHPTREGETITKSSRDANIVFFNKKLKKAIDDLAVLNNSDCSNKDALKAWNKVFNHDYFSEQIEKLNNEEKALIAESLSIGNKDIPMDKGLGGIGAVGTASASSATVKTGNAYGDVINSNDKK